MSIVESKEFFPPTDRELALRGVIRTGWSTVAVKQPILSEHSLPPEEIAIIKEVLHRAEAMERMEEIRVGLFMLKHKGLEQSCRGDGVNSCRICGINFSQRGELKPAGIQLCSICQKGVCQRCKTFSRHGKGELQILCHVCANQKELWRRSGAWLTNIMPNISLTDDELLRAQKKQFDAAHCRAVTIGRSVGSLPREFINPARLESSDETDEDEMEVSTTLDPQQSFTSSISPADSFPLPSLQFMKELHPKKGTPSPTDEPKALPLSFTKVTEKKESSTQGGTSGGSSMLFNKQNKASSTSSLPMHTQPSSDRVGDNLSYSTSTLPRSFGSEQKEVSAVHSRSFSAGYNSRKSPPGKEESPPARENSKDEFEASMTSSVEFQSSQIESMRERNNERSHQGISRRGAISHKDKAKMNESRRRARQKRDSRSPSSTSGNEGMSADYSSSTREESTASPSPVHVPTVPQIKVRRPTEPDVEPYESSMSIPKSLVEEGKESHEDDTPVASPVQKEFTKSAVTNKDGSLHYSTVEFKSSPAKATNDNSELFTKTTPKKATSSKDIPRDTTFVKYSQVDFTKTKPVIKDSDEDTPEFVKVRVGKSSAAPGTDSKTPRRMTTISEVPETTPPIPHHQKESKPIVETAQELDPENNPKVPTRSTSLKNRELLENDDKTPPLPPARSVSAESSVKEAPLFEKTKPMPRTRHTSTAVEGTETTHHSPPVPRARTRKNVSTQGMTSDVTQPPLPVKESPTKQEVPPLPPKEELIPNDNKPATRTMPAPDTKPGLPPLPPKEDSPNDMPQKPASPKNSPPSAKKDIFPSLPSKGDPPSKPPLPQKDQPPNTPPLPPKDIEESSKDAKKSLSTGPMTRGARVRSTISDKAVMGDLISEFRKKQAKLQSTPEEHEPQAQTEEPPKTDISKLSSPDASSTEEKKSPSSSPLRRRNATRTSRSRTSTKPTNTSTNKEPNTPPASGEDFPDGEDQYQFRRRSRAVRSHPRPAADTEPQTEMPRGRTRSSAVSGLQRPVRKAGRSSDYRQSEGVASIREDGLLDENSRPQSHSPAPDGLCGSIEVCLKHNEATSTLTVTVLRCKGLRPMDANGFSDPYVNLFLAPGHKMHDMQTDMKLKTLNPEYNENFVFEGVSKESLSDKQLHLVVMNHNEFTKDDFISGTRVNLYELLIAQSHSLTLRRLLDDKKVPNHRLREKTRGKIELSMRYCVKSERFKVHVIKADNLRSYGSQEINCDPFTKCHIDCKGKILKQRTKTCSKTVNPSFNEELGFSIRLQELPFCRMTLTVMDHKTLKDTFLGELHFDSISFWRRFMAKPDEAVHNWFELKALSFGGKTEPETYIPWHMCSSIHRAGHQVKQFVRSIARPIPRSQSSSFCHQSELESNLSPDSYKGANTKQLMQPMVDPGRSQSDTLQLEKGNLLSTDNAEQLMQPKSISRRSRSASMTIQLEKGRNLLSIDNPEQLIEPIPTSSSRRRSRSNSMTVQLEKGRNLLTTGDAEQLMEPIPTSSSRRSRSANTTMQLENGRNFLTIDKAKQLMEPKPISKRRSRSASMIVQLEKGRNLLTAENYAKDY